MFSKNGQISIRQTYRLLFFDLVGVGTLLLPTMLASTCGGAGLWSIVIGAFAAYIYLTIIDLAIKKMKTDLLSYLKKYKIIIPDIRQRLHFFGKTIYGNVWFLNVRRRSFTGKAQVAEIR